MAKTKEPETIRYVWCRLTFVGFHFWKGAPSPVTYLRHPHRHVFHVRASKRVTHNDREVEFITLKSQLQAYIGAAYEGKTFESSCEEIAEDLLETFRLVSCEVSEDGENGATVTKWRQ